MTNLRPLAAVVLITGCQTHPLDEAPPGRAVEGPASAAQSPAPEQLCRQEEGDKDGELLRTIDLSYSAGEIDGQLLRVLTERYIPSGSMHRRSERLDGQGRLWERVYLDDEGAAKTTQTWWRNEQGEVNQEVYESRDHPSNNRVTTYVRDEQGFVVSTTMELPDVDVRYVFFLINDEHGNPVTRMQDDDQDGVYESVTHNRFTYDEGGRLLLAEWGVVDDQPTENFEWYGYDDLGRLVQGGYGGLDFPFDYVRSYDERDRLMREEYDWDLDGAWDTATDFFYCTIDQSTTQDA